jgi:glycosyltransferase involved in cell wall biosynthesis
MNKVIKKDIIYFDLTKIIKSLNSSHMAGILRTEIEYLKNIINFKEKKVLGLIQYFPKNGKLHLIQLPYELTLSISRYYDFERSSVDIFVKSENQKKLNELMLEIKKIIMNVNLKKESRIDKEIFKNSNVNNLYINCAFFIDNPSQHKELFETLEFKRIYLIYDILPIEFPEFFWGDELSLQYFEIIKTITTSKTHLVAISHDVKNKLNKVLKIAEIIHNEILVAQCGVSEIFLNKRNFNIKKENKFSIFCTIEPRKNHLLLLNIWREMINSGMINIPKLSIIGRRGWNNEDVFRFLDKSDSLKEYVTEYNNMNDEDMINEILSSKATLFPSYGEGWGLPIVESMALGVPVICSDLPVHIECSQNSAIYINILKGDQWLEEIKKISQDNLNYQNKLFNKLNEFKPISWKKSAYNFLTVINKIK